jgi:uncharacterized protein (TIGR00369 family)
VSDPDDTERLRRLQFGFGIIPLNAALGITIVRATRAAAWMHLPWREDLVGNPETGVLHGGAITALMDTTCGASVFAALGDPAPIATLDLRIDYLRPATPRRDVTAKAECYKLTASIAFVRCIAYHEDENDPIAAAAGAFMVSPRKPRPSTDAR